MPSLKSNKSMLHLGIKLNQSIGQIKYDNFTKKPKQKDFTKLKDMHS